MTQRSKTAGRPSDFNLDTATSICTRIIEGESLRSICKDPESPAISTVVNWLARFPEFVALYTHARDNQADTLADDILFIADNEPDPDKARVRIDARKWIAAKLKPRKYGDRAPDAAQRPERTLQELEDAIRQQIERRAQELADSRLTVATVPKAAGATTEAAEPLSGAPAVRQPPDEPSAS
jgi:hypothetical protein